MSISNDFNILIQKRKAIEGNVDYDNTPVIKDMIDLMTKNVRQVVDFITNECSELKPLLRLSSGIVTRVQNVTRVFIFDWAHADA